MIDSRNFNKRSSGGGRFHIGLAATVLILSAMIAGAFMATAYAWENTPVPSVEQVDPSVAALVDYARQNFNAGGTASNFSPALPGYGPGAVAAAAAHAGLLGAPSDGQSHGEAAHGGSPHGASPHGSDLSSQRFMTQYGGHGRGGVATLKFPDDPIIKQLNDYARLNATLRAVTATEQRILRAHERATEQRTLRAQRAAREPDYVALMPAREEPLVKTWVALENLEDSDEPAPQFDFVQILARKGESSRPVLIAAQKQPKVSASSRAPMVAPAPGDPDGRYFVGSKPCETCHAGLFDEFGETLMGRGVKSGKITAQGKMECETCHGPGSAHVNGGGGREKGGIRSFRLTDSRGVDVEEFNGVCLSCHEKSDQTYWKGSTHENRGVACVNCHTVMRKVPARFQIKFATVGETCYQCHKDRKAQAQRTSHMPLRENKITCASCHNPHGSPTEALLKEATVNDTCYTCHADKRGPFLFEHAPVRENCLNCHQPHGSNHEALLNIARPRLCQQCHPAGHSQAGLGVASAGAAGTNTMRYVAGSSCQNCHTNVHGSNSPSGSRWHR